MSCDVPGLAGCCSGGGGITIYDNGNGSCSVIPPGSTTEQRCTGPLFGSSTCRALLCRVTLIFRALYSVVNVKPNMQRHLDTLGIGSAEYVSELSVVGLYQDTIPYIDGASYYIPTIRPSFYTGLRWVRQAHV